jgi:ribonuclease P protein component
MVMAREQAVGLPGPELLAELQLLWTKLRTVRLDSALKPGDTAGTIVR